jgi:hypothetical protein
MMYLPPPPRAGSPALGLRHSRARPRRWSGSLAVAVAVPLAVFPRGSDTTRLDGTRAGFRGLGYSSCSIRCD